MITDAELYVTLAEASSGLLYQTESDYPFEVLIHENSKEIQIIKESILKLMRGSPEDPIEEFDFDFLFATPTLDQDWHSPEDKKRVVRFRILVTSLKENLKEIKVFRKGKIFIDVYITGRAPSGNIAVVSTKQMQT